MVKSLHLVMWKTPTWFWFVFYITVPFCYLESVHENILTDSEFQIYKLYKINCLAHL